MNSNKFIQDNHKYWDWNGLKIFWSVVNESNKIPILLLHGFGASSAHWRNNISVFAKNGYAVYSMDLLGFGKSAQPGIKQIGKLDNGIWCDQVTDFINEIIRPVNNNKIVIIGNSLGGLIALTCGVAISEEISGIIASPLPDPVTLKIEKGKYNSFKIKLIEIFISLIPIKVILFFINRFGIIEFCLKSAYWKKDQIDNELLEIVTKPTLRDTASRSLRAMCLGMTVRSYKLKASYLLGKLSKIKKVPLLLIWGEKDNFIPLFYGERVAKLYPWVELKIIANSGHCVHDEDHYKFNKMSHEWIKGLKTF
tara:strand:- start:1911 stop:2837 length:927 start_codon:yes stop_codon:yes gene_type:complete